MNQDVTGYNYLQSLIVLFSCSQHLYYKSNFAGCKLQTVHQYLAEQKATVRDTSVSM